MNQFSPYQFARVAPPQPVDSFALAMNQGGVQYAQDWFSYSIDALAIPAGTTKVVVLNIMADSAFEILELAAAMAPPSGAWGPPAFPLTVQLMDSVSSRNLMSAPVPVQNICGTGANPFILPIPRKLMPSTQLSVAFGSYATVDALSVQLTFLGRKLFKAPIQGAAQPQFQRFNSWQDADGSVYSEDLYSYEFVIGPLAANASQLVSQLVEADSDFEWIATTASARGAGDTLVTPRALNLKISVEDGGSQRKLMSAATMLMNVAGDGQFPHVLKQSRIFQSKTPILLTVQNIDPVIAYSGIHITMIGRKIFHFQGQ